MPASLTTLLGRNFAIGSFLPAVILTFFFLELSHVFGHFQGIQLSLSTNALPENAFLLLSIVFLSLILLATNIGIIRFFMGAEFFVESEFEFLKRLKINPFRMRFWFPFPGINQREKYYQLIKKTIATQEQMKKAEKDGGGKSRYVALGLELGRHQAQLAKFFPHLMSDLKALVTATEEIRKEDKNGYHDRIKEKIYPTVFGNIVRAFEDYSKAVYGFNSDQGWLRVDPLVGSALKSTIQDEKSRMDFWLNLWFGSIVLLVTYFYFLISQYWWHGFFLFKQGWIPLVLLVSSFLFANFTKTRAIGWGTSIRAGMDLTLPNLATSLGYELPKTAKEKKLFWKRVSQLFKLRHPVALELLDPYVKGATASPPPPKPLKRSKKAAMPPRPPELNR